MSTYCDGGCVDHGGHSGPVVKCRVTHGGKDWGVFRYCTTAQRIDRMNGMKVDILDDNGQPLAEAEPDESITLELVNGLATKQPHVWDIPGTRFFLYEHVSGQHRGYWSISETDADGEEYTYCYVSTRSELIRMVGLVKKVQ